jgi:uncharacterized protein
VIDGLIAWLGYASPTVFWTLVGAATIGGLVRGFTGFGFAMVFVPIAALMVGAQSAAALIWLIDIPFAWPLAAACFSRVQWREVLPLLAGAIVAAPIGVWLLVNTDPATARWAIALLILAAVAALATGWRYRGAPGLPLSLGTGGLAGVASGLAQLGGMPVAIFWLAAQKNNPRQTKDNLNGFFAILPVVTGWLYWRSGILTPALAWMALPLCVPYGIALFMGARLFTVAPEKVFRRVAYGVIACAAVIAMPIIDPLLGR